MKNFYDDFELDIQKVNVQQAQLEPMVSGCAWCNVPIPTSVASCHITWACGGSIDCNQHPWGA